MTRGASQSYRCGDNDESKWVICIFNIRGVSFLKILTMNGQHFLGGDYHGDQVGCGAQSRNTFFQFMSWGEKEVLGTPTKSNWHHVLGLVQSIWYCATWQPCLQIGKTQLWWLDLSMAQEMAGWLHSRSCGQRLDVQVEISNERWPSGTGTI